MSHTPFAKQAAVFWTCFDSVLLCAETLPNRQKMLFHHYFNRLFDTFSSVPFECLHFICPLFDNLTWRKSINWRFLLQPKDKPTIFINLFVQLFPQPKRFSIATLVEEAQEEVQNQVNGRLESLEVPQNQWRNGDWTSKHEGFSEEDRRYVRYVRYMWNHVEPSV